MENEQVLKELKLIRKELKDIRSILELKEKDSIKKTIKQLVVSLEESIDSVQL